MGPAGSINSNLEDMSRWVVAQLNAGMLDAKQAIPANVIKETMAPALAMPNTGLEARGFGELLNAAYGAGRWTASYSYTPHIHHESWKDAKPGKYMGRKFDPFKGPCDPKDPSKWATQNPYGSLPGQNCSN